MAAWGWCWRRGHPRIAGLVLVLSQPKKSFLQAPLIVKPNPLHWVILLHFIHTFLTPSTIRPRPKSMAKDPIRLTAAPSTDPMFVKSNVIWRTTFKRGSTLGRSPHHNPEVIEYLRGWGCPLLHTRSPCVKEVSQVMVIMMMMMMVTADYDYDDCDVM